MGLSFSVYSYRVHRVNSLYTNMYTTLVLAACMVAVAMSQYVPEQPPTGDINNDGVPNYLDLNYDGKVDVYPYHHYGLYGLYGHHLHKRSVHPHVHADHLHGLRGHAFHGHSHHALHAPGVHHG